MSASARLNELKKRYNENPRRFFAPLANEFRKTGDLQMAIGICERHLAEQPSNMNGHVVYGQALFEAGRLEDAAATFANAVALDPENLIALRHLGDISRIHGDLAGARDWFRRILDADPRNEEVLQLLAAIDATNEGAGEASALPFIAVPDDDAPPQVAAEPAEPSIVALELPDFGELPANAVASADAPVFGFESTSAATDDTVVFGASPHEGLEDDAAPRFSETLPAEEPVTFEDPFAEPPEDRGSPFVTATMAELYLQQGHTERALEVYQQLALQRPDDEALKIRIRALMPAPAMPTRTQEFPIPTAARAVPPRSVGAVAGMTARDYFSRLSERQPVAPPPVAPPPVAAPVIAAPLRGDRSIDAFFGHATPAASDEEAALVLSTFLQAVGDS